VKKVSLRTKGLVLIVLISFIPLLLAGAGNYAAVKKTIMATENDKISSKLSSQAGNISSWLDIRRAEVLVMSRTSAVRFGTSEERIQYFSREMDRSGYAYQAIGYIGKNGLAVRSDGPSINMKSAPFYKDALSGKVVITDPYRPTASLVEQAFIAAPVYGVGTEIIGVMYASLPATSLSRYFTQTDTNSIFIFYNDDGQVLYSNNTTFAVGSSIAGNPRLEADSAEMLKAYQGRADLSGGYTAFYAKVAGTPWRMAQLEPISNLEKALSPIFWRTLTTIVLSEVIIGVLFFLYFERIIKRLESILHVTEKAAAGQFKVQHLDTSQGDEIGMLGHSVNGMMEHLQEMFDRLNAIVNQNQYGFIVLNEQYRVMYLNQVAEKMLGYKTQELYGHATPLIFMDMDDIELEARKLTELLGREIRPGIGVFEELRKQSFSYEREWTFIHKDGKRSPMLISSNGLRDGNGSFSGVVIMVRDISDRRHVEKMRDRLQNIVESAKDLIASIDHHGRVIYINRAGKEMLGVTELSNEPLKVHRHFERQMYEHLLKGAAQARELGYWESGTQLRKTNGESLFVSIIVVVHKDEATGELFYSCIARDVSEQKLVQEELVRATLEAEEANKAKSRFLALMSHEIRTPLNGIIGLTGLMRKTNLSHIQRDYLDKMHASSDSLLRIINDVLDFSKIEAEKIEVERFPFQPDELLGRLANQLSVFLGGKEQFELMIKTPKRLPIMLIGDSMRLEQVLLNLCMNAIKFTDHGHVKLELDVADEAEDYITVSFLIEDTGIGMSQEQVERLFKPFTQADSSTTRKFGGTGLGLVISKNLVELMGGSLEVSSHEGVGSLFSFELTFAADPYRYADHEEAESLGKDQTIWLLEDDHAMREHWTGVLEESGYAVISFGSWHTAMERLRRSGKGARPQFLMADMEMPDMYGTDTWLAMHRIAEEASVPVIAYTTTFGRDELIQLPKENRPLSILIKPATRYSLLRTLKDAMQQPPVSKEPPQLPPAPEKQVPPPQAKPVKVLLAEDNKINQLVAIELLKECGCEVSVAENGQAALDMLEREPWDLILMDIHMPVMDGTEAVRIIRSRPEFKDLPVIAVTANVVKKDHEQYLRLGMNGVITKPLSVELIRDMLDVWLEPGTVSEEGAGDKESADRRFPSGSARVAPDRKLGLVAGMDSESALERVNGKLPILLHMMEQFRIDYESFMNRLKMMIDQKDESAVLRMLHTLKGAAGYLSARELVAATAEAEAFLKEESGGESFAGHLLPLERLEFELNRLLGGLKAAKTEFDKKI